MKRVSFVFLCLAFTMASHAQLRFGVKAGLNLANISVSDASGVSYSMKPDFHAGVLVAIPLLGKLSLQPEVVYSGQGSDVKEGGQKGKYNLQYVNVPVLVRYEIMSGLNIETGPQLGLLLGAKVKADGGASTDIKNELKTADFGWTLGASYLLPLNLGFDVRYNLGLTNTVKDSGNGSIKNGVLQVGLFYLFGKK
ncbi:MAG: porin family protein [Mucilaginibacter sp.]